MIRGWRLPFLSVSTRVRVGHIDNGNMAGVEVNGGGEADDLTRCMGAKFGRIDAIVDAGMQRVFSDLEEVFNRIGVETRDLAVIFVDIIISTDGGGDVAVQFVTA